jgi:UDP:flavonoid glycosyltransferase YjiC (YdhE family)/2-polyprenyl-3-methyl-5-hydroxy-6-metoxy-1,4-benzoquinol methylase
MKPATKFLIAAAPRSATAYISRLLTNLDIRCGHESFFKFAQRWNQFLDTPEVLGDASWLAVPFLERFPQHVRILHQTRHPLNVIRSLLEIRFLEVDESGRPARSGLGLQFTQFAYHHCPILFEYRTGRERSMWFYYHWNKMIQDAGSKRRILRYDIESLGTNRARQILEHLNVSPEQVPDELLAAHLQLLPRNINTKRKEKTTLVEGVRWDQLPGEVQELARSYGYDAPIPTAEVVDGWAAREDELQRSAQLIVGAARAKRDALTTEIQQLHAQLRQTERSEHSCRKPMDTREHALAVEQASAKHTCADERDAADAQRARSNWMACGVSGQRILDAACGHGSRALDLAREGLQVVGLEVDPTAIAAAQAARETEMEWVQQRVSFVRGAVATVKLEPASFDTVILSDWPARVVRPDRLLEIARSLLVDEGRLLVSVPLGCHPNKDYVSTFHFRNLNDLLEKSFSVDSCEVIGGYLCILAHKPKANETPRPLSPERSARAHQEAADALVQLQRHVHSERQRLAKQVEQLEDRLTAALAEKAGLAERIAQLELALERFRAQSETMETLLVRAQATQVRLAGARPDLTAAIVNSVSATGKGTAQSSGGILFLCSNGAGLGHLTRSLAVARRMRRIDPALPIYFLSSSLALPVIAREGMVAYHIPPQSELSPRFNWAAWNELLKQMLGIVIDTHRPSALVYDGVSPFRGLLDVIAKAGFSYTGMILRLRHKHDRLLKLGAEFGRFDELIFPGERGVSTPAELTGLHHFESDPIVFLDRAELLPRAVARQRWNVAPSQKLVYVQLGAGNINDTRDWVKQVLNLLRKQPDVEVVLAESPISKRVVEPPPGVHTLSHYPNSLYFNAFDLAIAATGYNTFHELMHFGVPSIFIPNQQTVTDDQVGRAKSAEDVSAARVVLDRADLEPAILEFLREDVAQTARAKAVELVPRNGAADVARHVLEAASARIEAACCAVST